jgi:hypothetical protein
MFATLRAAAVIGVIFYLSPLRTVEAPSRDRFSDVATAIRLADLLKDAASALPGGPIDRIAEAEALWDGLPEGAKRALLDRILSGNSSSLPTEAKRALLDRVLAGGLSPTPSEAKPPSRDTLKPDDLQPAWRGEAKRSQGEDHGAPGPRPGKRVPDANR